MRKITKWRMIHSRIFKTKLISFKRHISKAILHIHTLVQKQFMKRNIFCTSGASNFYS